LLNAPPVRGCRGRRDIDDRVAMLIEEDELKIACTQPHPGEGWEAAASIDADLTPVMPYINAVAQKPEYHPGIPVIVWRHGGRRVAVRPHEIAVDDVADTGQAAAEIGRVIDWLNDLWERRDGITPVGEPRVNPPLMSVLKRLPMNNCRECGLPTCTAFAAALIDGTKGVDDCPPLATDEWRENAEALKEMGMA